MSEVADPVPKAVPERSTFGTLSNWAFAPNLGVFLVCTAILKALDPIESEKLRIVYELPEWLTVAGVQAELALGLLLLSGRGRRMAWLLALGMFTIFALFSLDRALSGFESCGCFGRIKVNPWWTAALDAAVVAVLIIRRGDFLKVPVRSSSPVRIAACIVAYCTSVCTILTTWLPDGPNARSLEAVASEPETILEPKTWIGQHFSLVEHISPRVDVTVGEWAVLFYHHDCPKCQETLRRYEEIAKHATLQRLSRVQVLLLEIPPYGPQPRTADAMFHARLSDKHEWFVQTPFEIQLSDGMVVAASAESTSFAHTP